MIVTRQIDAILDNPESATRRLAAAMKLPCCSFVTALMLELEGKAPADPTILGNWNDGDTTDWEVGNLWGKYGHWANLPHPYIICAPLAPSQPDFMLQIGFWHEVQVWNKNYTKGHNYLLHHTGGAFRLVDSNTDLGLRERFIECWEPSKHHYFVGVHAIRQAFVITPPENPT